MTRLLRSSPLRSSTSRPIVALAVLALAAVMVLPLPLAAAAAGRVTASPVLAAAETIADDPAASGLEDERDRNRTDLEAIAAEAERSQKALRALEQDLNALKSDQQSLSAALDQSGARRAELDAQIAAGEASLSDLNNRQQTLRTSLISRRSVLAEVLAALQRIGRNPPPALLVTPEDALSSVRSAILLGAVVPGIREETEALAADLKELAELRRSIASERESLKLALDANALEEERLSALATEKVALQAESERRLEMERERADNLSEKSTELETLIASLETEIGSLRAAAEEARRAEIERRERIAEQLERARELAATVLPDKNRIAPAYAFSALKGTLRHPADGETVRHFGADDGAGHAFAGEVVASGTGAPVVAPVDGWVIYAGPFRSYGQVVILDVGENYQVILAGMGKARVATGQFVLAGEPVAEMGQTRLAGLTALALASGKPTLYIEFRRGGEPVDPRPWWRDESSSGRASNDT